MDKDGRRWGNDDWWVGIGRPVGVPVRPDRHANTRPDEPVEPMPEMMEAMPKAMVAVPTAMSTMPTMPATRLSWHRTGH